MNPKDMTKEQVIIGLSDALRVEINHLNKPDDRIYALNYRQTMESELLRRLDEADALRKENEGLREALIDARSWMDAGMFEDVPPQYTAMVANVDAVLSKESEASHE